MFANSANAVIYYQDQPINHYRVKTHGNQTAYASGAEYKMGNYALALVTFTVKNPIKHNTDAANTTGLGNLTITSDQTAITAGIKYHF